MNVLAGSEPLVYKEIDSPTGKLTVIVSRDKIIAILWGGERYLKAQSKPFIIANSNPLLLAAEKQLNEYFAGKRTVFDLPLSPDGTDFQKQVWWTLLTIPFGETRTYGDIARQLGDPGVVRAVGGALNKNPIVIVLPCHRVIGASGKLVGFGGGIDNKKILLDLEKTSRQLSMW